MNDNAPQVEVREDETPSTEDRIAALEKRCLDLERASARCPGQHWHYADVVDDLTSDRWERAVEQARTALSKEPKP